MNDTFDPEQRRDAPSLPDDHFVSETLRRIGMLFAAELDLDPLVQRITDEATAVCRARFGAFFYNVANADGEAFTLYALSGAPREAFSRFGTPRNTAIFAPTFAGEGVVRLDDVTRHPGYGQNPPHHGMPPGHLPVRSYLAVPVVARSGEVIGGLFFGHPEPGVFTVRDERVLVGIAAQAAVAIDNARLFQKLQRAEETAARQARQAALVADVALALTADAPLDGVLRRCAEALVRHLDAAFARVWMLEPDGATLRLRASAGLYTHLDGAHARVPVGALKIGLIAQEQRPHLTNDVLNDPRVGDHAWAAREGLVSFAGYPLRVAGRLVGVVATFARKPFAQDVLDVLASVADAVALGIERHRLLAEAQERAEAQAFLAQTGALLASSIDYETTLANVARLAVPRVADWCGVDIVDPDGTLRQLAVAHVDPAKVELARELRRRFPPDPDAPLGVPAVVRTGRAELIPVIPDAALVEAARGDAGLLDLFRALGLRSSMCVPLVVNERVLGALSLVSAESGKVYTEADLQLAEELARRAASAVENARLYAEVRRLNATLERRVEERTAQLTEVNRELEAFTYTVSHDLRAPIRHVGGFTDLLERHLDADLDEKGRRYVRTIRDAARQMGSLIDALLAFSRIGRTEPRRARVELDALTREVLRELEPETAGRSVVWEISALPAIEGDPTLVRLVLTNLLSNAVKYTRPRPAARIEVGSRPADEPGQVALFVRDNGVGFRPEYVPKLFGVFQRLHNDKQFEGTGVGLATVRRIVQRHGGRVWAEGAEDRGATFFFTLPLAESTPP